MKLTTIALLSYLLAGCATMQLWMNQYYTEHITNFYSSKDGDTLVVIGKEYHYVFSNTYDIYEVMQSDYRSMMSAKFEERFFVSTENIISGKFKIICDCSDPLSSMKIWLESQKFEKDFIEGECSKKEVYSKEITLTGIRYDKGEVDIEESSQLNDKYHVVIEEEPSSSDTPMKILLTPLSAAADGVITVGAISIAAATWPVMIFNALYLQANSDERDSEHEEKCST